MRHHCIGAGPGDAHVLAGFRRLARLRPFVDPAVAVGVEHEWMPALCLRRVAGLVPHLRVYPASDWARAREPERVLGVVAELRVVGAEACIEVVVFHRLGIKHRHLTSRLVEREDLGRGMIRALLAEGRVLGAAHRRREPHPALPVEHAVVVVSALAPDLLVAPIGRGRRRRRRGREMERRSERFRRVRIETGHLKERHLVRLRVEDRNVVARVFGRAVEQAVGVDGWLAPVRRDQVVEEGLFCAPLP